MPTTKTYFDTETTYEVKTFTQILSCGECNAGQLLPTALTTDSGATIHACANCGRTQAVAGEVYP